MDINDHGLMHQADEHFLVPHRNPEHDDDVNVLNNGVNDMQIHDVDDNYHHLEDNQGVIDFVPGSSDFSRSYCGGSLTDIYNSSRQNSDGSNLANVQQGNLYDNKFPRFKQISVLSEDLRISKILRRLMIETNRKAAVELCKKLDGAVRNQSNASYICRSFDILFDNMITVLRQCPADCLQHASEILGVMGYINRYDFTVYKNNLTKSYANNKNLRQYMMIALKTTLSCDAVNLDLKPYSERILTLLKEYLENAEVAENFIAISETISELSKHYNQSFHRHFTDIVDIIIGWHLEIEQPAYLKRHCAKILQQFAVYFLDELDFTLGLLGQFIEDIDACGEEIIAEEVSMKSKQQTEARVGAFIGAFTSIVKAMVSKGVVLSNFTSSANILKDAKEVVNKVAKQCFHVVALISEETVINLNEFYCVISSYDKSVENLCDLEGIIELQLHHLSEFNEKQVSSFLYMVLNVVRQYRTQLPLSFVSLVMNKEHVCLHELKLSCGSKPYRMLLKTYHEILNIKNVPLLQEAYRHILKDVNETIGDLKAFQNSMYSAMRSELIFSFYLSALSAMACQTSSIIGMYALNPSILELLISNCQAANELLWSKYPTLHQALLAVIIEHSSKNYNFRQSSRLLTQHQDSPTSENFGIILKFLAKLMRWHVSPELLNWFEQILEECKEDFAALVGNDDFLEMCDNITLFARKKPLMCSRVLVSILRYRKVPDYILFNIRDIALLALETPSKEVLSSYSQILALLPLEVCLSINHTQFYYYNKERLSHLYHGHKSGVCYNTLRPKYFKTFIDSLEPSFDGNDCLYKTFIEKSIVHFNGENANDYFQEVQENDKLMNFHLQYEAARYCVQQKLRTALGKPQETFLAIEAIVMKYARFLAEKESMPDSLKNFNKAMEMQQNSRILLGFLENLEKHIYNAAEGTAYAMLPAEKPAKTFFRVNATTCGEWFKRIRTAVNLIALHCMEPEMVIRYSEHILQSDTALNNASYLDRTITSLVWALLNCKESDSLYGLLAWLKSKQFKGYEWIQYVAEHASGHLEKAIVGYTSVLNDDNLQILDAFTKDFIQTQLTECLYITARWSEIPQSFQNKLYSKRHLECMETIYKNSVNQTYNGENEDLTNALLKMTEWSAEYRDNQSSQKVESFSYYAILLSLQDSCIARSSSIDIENTWFESTKKCIQQGLRDGIMHSYETGLSNAQLKEFLILNHVAHKMDDHNTISISNNEISMSSDVLSKALCWSLLMRNKSMEGNIPLLLNMAATARLENNLTYSKSLLERFFELKDIQKPLTQIVRELKSNELYIDCSDLDLVNGVEELLKYMQAQNSSTSDAMEIGSTCCVQIIRKQLDPLSSKPRLPGSIVGLLLTMSDWLTTHRLYTTSLTNGKQFQNLQNLLPDISFCSQADNYKSGIIPASEYAVGKLLNASILCKDKSGEAWYAFGNWCYRWGKKLMEASGNEQTTPDVKEIKLTARNIASIQEILGVDFDNLLLNRIVDLLNTHMLSAIKDDTVDPIYANSHNVSAVLECELKNICSLSVDQLSGIISIWRQAHKGVYGFYEEATRAYFKYLAIQSDTVSTKKTTSSIAEIEDCTFVTTTLRLLRLIVKHAIGLQDVLEEGLRNTPLRPWKVIVPQLFSRLNHHEPYVRQSVSDLLCRLAANQPQLIIFPAVVGAQQELKHCDSADSQMQLSNCFVGLLNSLSNQAPDMVLQVQLLVKELRRIALLWEEYWIHALAQLYAEYSHLYNALDVELKKPINLEVLLAKCDIFRHHLLTDFKKIVAVTDKEPETSYERSFQERFKPHIENVLNELQKPPNLAKLSECWQKIKQLYNIFQQRPIRGNSSTIRISDVSPVLANMRNTSIAMPGVDTSEQSAVYINAVNSTIFILPTKTKPKKLSLCGSNGQNYTYLFKGQEDLHLDERIMQFLSISNSMMSRSYGSKSKTDCFNAHHYSVIPLGPQSGLISWVDNCTPLFAIYKKWQQRDAILKQQQKERQLSKSNEPTLHSPPTVANTSRPSELFYNKLTPLLAERSLKITDPRKQWPMQVLKRVLRELSQETPKDLLAKEIWCYSATPVDWRKSVRRYTMSMAVMSIIGYIIGLGDRHLDNILIKLGTGEIVHIDYNVCFEKGKSLRVPEKVPFRLTQNLKDAMGLVGTEGTYRLACSHVLKVLRKERETLLTLLEAFVYDPLVDWTISDDGNTTVSRGTSAHNAAVIITALGSSRGSQLSPKDMLKCRKHDIDLSRQTLAIKITEIRPAWLKYKNNFDIQLRNVQEHIQYLLDLRQNIINFEQERDNFTKQLAMIRELDALGSARGSHALNTVSQRYSAYKQDLESFRKIKQLVEQTIKDLDVVLSTYFDILLSPNKINEIEIIPVGNDSVTPTVNEFELVKDLLIGNNWNQFYTQAVFTKCEMDNSFLQTQRSAGECRDLLLFYSQVMRFYPRSKLQTNHLIKYKNSYAELIESDGKECPEMDSIDRPNSDMNTRDEYFANLMSTHSELQSHITEAKLVYENRKLQQVVDHVSALNKINEYITLNSHNNSQLLWISVVHRIELAYERFVTDQNVLLSRGDYFLLNHQIHFIQIIGRFVGCLNAILNNPINPEILDLLIESLHALELLRVSMEDLCLEMFSMFITSESLYLNIEHFKMSPEFNVKYDEAEVLFNNTILLMQKLQEKFSYLQEVQPNSIIDQIMNSWSISICEYMKSCRNEMMARLMCNLEKAASSLKSHDIQHTFDIRQIKKPVADMFLNVQTKLFTQLSTYVIQGIKFNIDDFLSTEDAVNETFVNECNALCDNLYAALENEASLECDQQLIIHYSKQLEQQRIIATAYSWFNELQFESSTDDIGHIVPKQEFLANLHNSSQVLSAWKSTMLKIQTDIELHRKTVKELISTMSSSSGEIYQELMDFDDAVYTVNQMYIFFLNLATRLTEYSAVLLQFEMSGGKEPFETLVKQFKDEHNKLQSSELSITMVERNLVQLLDPEDKIDQCWIENVSDLLDEMIFSVQKKICDLEKDGTSMEGILQSDAQKLQVVLDSSIRLDLRQLLKLITKSCKQTSNMENGDISQDIRDIQQSMKLLQSKVNDMQIQLFSREFETQILIEMRKKVDELFKLCETTDDCLNILIDRFMRMDTEHGDHRQIESPLRNGNSTKDCGIHNSQLVEQKRNAYAVSVWKRIRMKLEGRDPDPNRRSSVTEQVDYIISEATNEENLASLYEGWTPWV